MNHAAHTGNLSTRGTISLALERNSTFMTQHRIGMLNVVYGHTCIRPDNSVRLALTGKLADAAGKYRSCTKYSPPLQIMQPTTICCTSSMTCGFRVVAFVCAHAFVCAARCLESKPFLVEYWKWQHRFLLDAVNQFGAPSIFLTISPYEWSFPVPVWLSTLRDLIGKGPTHLAAFETAHITHVLEQIIRGYLCGTNDKRWSNHVFNFINISSRSNIQPCANRNRACGFQVPSFVGDFSARELGVNAIRCHPSERGLNGLKVHHATRLVHRKPAFLVPTHGYVW